MPYPGGQVTMIVCLTKKQTTFIFFLFLAGQLFLSFYSQLVPLSVTTKRVEWCGVMYTLRMVLLQTRTITFPEQ